MNQAQAQKVLDPILGQLAKANAGKMCKQLPKEVNMTVLERVLDFEMTAKANKSLSG